MNHLTEQLLAKMPPDEIYPKGVVAAIRPKIRGRSFFPGGNGLFQGASQPACQRPIILVGQDFGDLAYWSQVGEIEESKQGTWAALERMLKNASIDPRCCFFTNALLGVRVNGPIDGPSPGLSCPPFVQACMEFLLEQLRVLQPSVVVGLGKVPAVLLARSLGMTDAIPSPCADDSQNASWSEIDRVITPFNATVTIPGVSSFAFATSVHPDRHWLNWNHRTWSSENARGRAAHDLIWSKICEAHRKTHV